MAVSVSVSGSVSLNRVTISRVYCCDMGKQELFKFSAAFVMSAVISDAFVDVIIRACIGTRMSCIFDHPF